MNTRYSVTPASSQADANGNLYADVVRMPLNDLKLTVNAKRYCVNQADLDRFDITVATEYGAAEYDDLVLWFNGFASIHDVKAGDILLFPDKVDLDNFIMRNQV